MRFATKAARARGFIRLGIGLPRQDSGETGDGSWQERFRGPMPAKKAQMGAEQALGTLFDMAPVGELFLMRSRRKDRSFGYRGQAKVLLGMALRRAL